MGRIDSLIQQYCPNGVEYKPIGKIGEIIRGKRFVHNDDCETGIPAIHYGELYTYYGVSTSEVRTHIRTNLRDKMRYAHRNDVIVVGAGENKIDIGIGVAWLGDEDVAVHDACFILTNHNQNPVYLSYYLRTEEYHKQLFPFVSEGKICSFLKDGLAQVKIPVPPLPVQDEIVRILDRMTDLESRLTKGLATELELRKKQYEYYRDTLLSLECYEGEVEYIPLGEIALVTKLAGFEFSQYMKYSNTGKIIALRGLNVKNGRIVLNNVKYADGSDFSKLTRTNLKLNDLLYTYVGTVGEVGVIDKNDTYCLAPNVAMIRVNDEEHLNPHYLKYFLMSGLLKRQMHKLFNDSTLKNITMTNIREFVIPVIPLEEQKRIVSILDKLSIITNDISDGFLAEIQMRRQQLEYCRNNLFGFKVKET